MDGLTLVRSLVMQTNGGKEAARGHISLKPRADSPTPKRHLWVAPNRQPSASDNVTYNLQKE